MCIRDSSIFWSADFNGRSDNLDVIQLDLSRCGELMPKKLQFSMFYLLVGFFVVAAVLAVVVGFARSTSWISEFEPLAIGMTKADVLEIVGQPTSMSKKGDWTYTPLDYGEPVFLFFDGDVLINANYPLRPNAR